MPSVSSVQVVFWWNLLLSLLEEAYYKLKKFEVLKLLVLRQQLEYDELCVQPAVVLHECSLAESWMNVRHFENFMKRWKKCPDLWASQKLSWMFSHFFMEWWTLVFSLMQKYLTYAKVSHFLMTLHIPKDLLRSVESSFGITLFPFHRDVFLH